MCLSIYPSETWCLPEEISHDEVSTKWSIPASVQGIHRQTQHQNQNRALQSTLPSATARTSRKCASSALQLIQPGIQTYQTHINKLQMTKNSAVRIVTGSTRSTPIDHLHQETHVLPLNHHMTMRATHIFSSTGETSLRVHILFNTPAHAYGFRFDGT